MRKKDGVGVTGVIGAIVLAVIAVIATVAIVAVVILAVVIKKIIYKKRLKSNTISNAFYKPDFKPLLPEMRETSFLKRLSKR